VRRDKKGVFFRLMTNRNSLRQDEDKESYEINKETGKRTTSSSLYHAE
jgi:hypothetical protein